MRFERSEPSKRSRGRLPTRKLEEQYYQAVLDVAKGGIERARAGAETVQKASAAIVTLYTGILGLAFAAAETPLPSRALFAAFLLGLALVLSTVFIAYLPNPGDTQVGQSGDATLVPSDRRASLFIDWSREVALRRHKWLRASVVALGASLFFLPAPFVVFGEKKVEPVAEAISWPPAPDQPTDPQLKRILYTARVAEARKERKEPLAAEDNTSDFVWGLLFITSIFLVIGLAQLPREDSSRIDLAPTTSSGASP